MHLLLIGTGGLPLSTVSVWCAWVALLAREKNYIYTIFFAFCWKLASVCFRNISTIQKVDFEGIYFMAPFYGWGSTASRLEPLRGDSLLFTTKYIISIINHEGSGVKLFSIRRYGVNILLKVLGIKTHQCHFYLCFYLCSNLKTMTGFCTSPYRLSFIYVFLFIFKCRKYFKVFLPKMCSFLPPTPSL